MVRVIEEKNLPRWGKADRTRINIIMNHLSASHKKDMFLGRSTREYLGDVRESKFARVEIMKYIRFLDNASMHFKGEREWYRWAAKILRGAVLPNFKPEIPERPEPLPEQTYQDLLENTGSHAIKVINWIRSHAPRFFNPRKSILEQGGAPIKESLDKFVTSMNPNLTSDDLTSIPKIKQVISKVKKTGTTFKKVGEAVLEKSQQVARALAFSVMMGNALRMMNNTLSANISYDAVHQRFERKFHSSLKAEAVVGPVPLYSIQSMERAQSDRKLKYRAIGDVFLAHQKGGNDTLRIDGTLFGPLRYLYLEFLIDLQKSGETQLKSPVDSGDTVKYLIENASSAQKESGVKIKNNELYYEFHKTFPIITQSNIMLNMFLQTIEWHREINDGMEIIKYHLLFRKYDKPESWQAFVRGEDKMPNLSKGILWNNSSSIREEQVYDFIWKMIVMYGELFIFDLYGINKIDYDLEAVSNVNKLVGTYNIKKFVGKYIDTYRMTQGEWGYKL